VSIFRFSNAGGFGTYQRYNDFLAGNPTTPVYVDNGAMFPLGEFTLAAAQANVEFTNIPQTYTHLQLRAFTRATSGSFQNVIMRMNSDTGSNYNWHYLEGTGSGTPISSNSPNDTSIYLAQEPGSTQATGIFGTFIVDILDYKNTNKFKTVRSLSGVDANGSGRTQFWSGAWRSSSAITSILLRSDASNNFAENTQFALYGVLA